MPVGALGAKVADVFKAIFESYPSSWTSDSHALEECSSSM